MDTKFTPGPWEIVDHGNAFDINCAEGTVVTAHGKDNAAVISACPDMYAALAMVLGKIKRNPFSGDHKIEDWGPRDSEIVHKAMYKAEGK